jgi:predicted DNA-binding transcriptional regulator YafY
VSSPRVTKNRAKAAGRPAGAFTQHRRIDKLRELLESEPRGLTLDELARMLRVDQRSVRRYLRELDGSASKDHFDLLESVKSPGSAAHRWRIKPGERGRAVTLRRAQAYSLLSTRRALDILKGSALFDEADLALAQIEKVAQTPFRTQGKNEISGERGLEARFFWNPPPTRSYAARGEDLDEVFRAVADLRVLRFRPRTRADDPKADRVVFHPFAMVVHDGSIVLIGANANERHLDHTTIASLESMSEIRASETEHFELPKAFDIQRFVHGAFGLGSPSKSRVLIEFDARIADDIRARKWSPDQRIAMSPDGRLRLSIPLVDTDALVAWVLGFGDTARVIEPADIARRVGDVLQRAAARYK